MMILTAAENYLNNFEFVDANNLNVKGEVNMSNLKVKLLAHTPNPEEVVASSAKLCYSPVGIDEIMENLNDKSINKFINNLNTIKHHSPFEHISFTFAVEGVSRSLTHQLVRHRLASYSQQSQRYVKENEFEYIIPSSIRNNKDAKKLFVNHMNNSQETYDLLVIELMFWKMMRSNKTQEWCNKVDKTNSDAINHIHEHAITTGELDELVEVMNVFKDNFKKEYNAIEKEAIEDARYVFPNACETKIVITMNARALLHLFETRCCNRAQWEIRNLADEMLALVYQVAPSIFSKSGPTCSFGKCEEGKMTCGKPRSFNSIVKIGDKDNGKI